MNPSPAPRRSGGSESDRKAGRIQRLRDELEAEGVGVSSELNESALGVLLEEVVHSRYVSPHEGTRPTYGALVASPGEIERMAVSLVEFTEDGPHEVSEIRPFADGIVTYVWRDREDETACRLAQVSATTELGLLGLLSGTDARVVRRTASGEIIVLSRSQVWTNSEYAWAVRPRARSRVVALHDQIGIGDAATLELLARVLDFSFHVLSANRVGATLILHLSGDASLPEGAVLGEGAVVPIAVSLDDDTTLAPLETLLASTDGACLFDADGRATRFGVMLGASERAIAMTRPLGGTRHTSALRFSFDHDDLVAIVVSADGPVSIFFRGVRIMTLEEEPARETRLTELVPGEARSVAHSTMEVTCGGCERLISITSLVTAGSAPQAEGIPCPVCGEWLKVAVGAHPRVRVERRA